MPADLTHASISILRQHVARVAGALDALEQVLGPAPDLVPLRVEDLPDGFQEHLHGDDRYGPLVALLTPHAGPILCRAFCWDRKDAPWVTLRFPGRNRSHEGSTSDVMPWSADPLYPLSAMPLLWAQWLAQERSDAR